MELSTIIFFIGMLFLSIGFTFNIEYFYMLGAMTIVISLIMFGIYIKYSAIPVIPIPSTKSPQYILQVDNGSYLRKESNSNDFSLTPDCAHATRYPLHNEDADFLKQKGYRTHIFEYWDDDRIQHMKFLEAEDYILELRPSDDSKFQVIMRTLAQCRSDSWYLMYEDGKISYYNHLKSYEDGKFIDRFHKIPSKFTLVEV